MDAYKSDFDDAMEIANLYRVKRDILREAFRSQHSYPPMTKVQDLPLPGNTGYRLLEPVSVSVGRRFRDDD